MFKTQFVELNPKELEHIKNALEFSLKNLISLESNIDEMQKIMPNLNAIEFTQDWKDNIKEHENLIERIDLNLKKLWEQNNG